MERPRILVCGGRDFTNYELLRETLDDIIFERAWTLTEDVYGNFLPNVVIIHGGAKGADLLADQWAVVNWAGLEEYKAEWDKYGNRAGPIRNQRMLDEGKPQLVVAFPTPNSKGTWDMIRRAKRHGIETIIVGDYGPKSKNSQ